jgi:cell division septation protein DedD
MASMPGLRTRPTVKPLATMNKKNLSNWELRLGIVQVAVVVGTVMGAIICAFAFGLFTGKRIGFDTALSTSISQTSRIPITRDIMDEESQPDDVSRVYAKLNNSMAAQDDLGLEEEEAELPELAPIKSTADIPVMEGVARDLIGADEGESKKKDPAPAAVLEDQAQNADKELVKDKELSSNTLGTVLRRNDQSVKDRKIALQQEQPQVEDPQIKVGDEAKKTPVAVSRKEPKAELLKITGKTPPKKLEVASVKPAPVRTTGSFGTDTPITKSKKRSNGLAVSKTAVSSVVPSGWYAQVSAPQEVDDANNLARKLKNSGFRPVIEKAHVRGQSYFRVLVGPEDNRDQAMRLKAQLVREKYVKGDPFVKRIK